MPEARPIIEPEGDLAFERLRSWAGKFHCSHVDKVRGAAAVCPEQAVRFYRRQDGARMGYCAPHIAAGIAEAGRRGWELDHGLEEAVA